MKLFVDSDAACLVLPNAKSRVAGYFYLSSTPPENELLTNNAPILVICKMLQSAVASTAEAETAGVFINVQLALPIRHTLQCLGYAQPPTPMKSDNSTTTGFAHGNMHQKRSKSWDMKFHWLRDKETQKIIRAYWDKGENNLADPRTKHHLTTHHLDCRIKNNKFLMNNE